MASIRSVLVGFFLSFVVSSVALADAARQTPPRSRRALVYKWRPVAGAAYYSGRYRYRGSPVTFRTSSHWIMLREVKVIEVHAVGATGKLLATVPVSTTSPRRSRSVKKVAVPTSLSTEQTLAAELAAGKDWDPLSDDDANAALQGQFGRQLEHPGRLQLALHLSIGQESLVTQAGIDSYDGRANIGSTSFRVAWQPANALWYLTAAAEAHNLSTTAAHANEHDQTFLRTTGKSFLFYDVAGSSGREVGSLGVGFGVIHTRLPVMGITDQDQGSATLRLQSATGPALAIELSNRLWDSGAFHAWLSYQPTSFAPAIKALSAEAESTLRWQFSNTWFADFAGAWHWYRLRSAQACKPAACQNFSQSTSTVLMVSSGIGVKF